jgi:hypothetical protein
MDAAPQTNDEPERSTAPVEDHRRVRGGYRDNGGDGT